MSVFVNIGDTIPKPLPDKYYYNPSTLLNELAIKEPELRVVWITDHHARTDRPYMLTRTPVLTAAINSETYDFVIDSGDALEGGTGGGTRGTDVEQTALYTDFTDTLDGGNGSGIPVPRYNAIGNHDIYPPGFSLATSVPLLGMPAAYYFVDQGSWRFIFLNSFETNGLNVPYVLGTTQTTWLTDTLAASTDKNVCIVSHIPIIGISNQLWYFINGNINPALTNTWNPTVDQHGDVLGLINIIQANPCVKICLSGHTHGYDECTYPAFGVRAMCGGSTSGFYWNVSHEWAENYAGFNRMKFFADGKVEREIVYY